MQSGVVFTDELGRPLRRATSPAQKLLTVWLHGRGASLYELEAKIYGSRVRIDERRDPSSGPDARRFMICFKRAGTYLIMAKLPQAPDSEATACVRVDAFDDTIYDYYYHGTTRASAEALVADPDISPKSVPESMLQYWGEYTDFGKGFYIHPPENRKMAIDWAKIAGQKNNSDWGVFCAPLLPSEFGRMGGQHLFFKSKHKDRPENAPVLRNGMKANWIEFVEHNRHIQPGVHRPKDNDWSGIYGVMRGPLWTKADSRMKSEISTFPDHVHQITLGMGGLKVLNEDAVRKRRFVITKENEGIGLR